MAGKHDPADRARRKVIGELPEAADVPDTSGRQARDFTVTTVLYPEQTGYLEALRGAINARLKTVPREQRTRQLTRAEIIRGLITGAADSGVQLDTCLTEQDLAATVADLLRKGAGR